MAIHPIAISTNLPMEIHVVQPPHFVLMPYLAQGHSIPMVDIARMLARSGVIVTILTTLHNAKRFESIIARAIQNGLQIRVIHLDFPCVEAGLPQGCENLDLLSSIDMVLKFFTATKLLQPQVEKIVNQLNPPPSCMISDFCYPWTINVTEKIGIPLLLFHGFSCFALFVAQITRIFKHVLDGITSDREYFELPGLPDRIESTKSHLGAIFLCEPDISQEWKDLREEMIETGDKAYGIVVNTFEELETEYVKEYTKATGKHVWCIGPVSLCNNAEKDKAERGKKSSINEHECLKWLDSWEPNSVLYVCLGSITRLATSQMIQLGLGLESSNRPFIWVVGHISEELKKWFVEEKFEERTKNKGLIIQGWAPQVVILSHSSIKGFLTHCGWNSTLEGICSGVPMLTMPAFAEQFINEKLVVNVLKIGVKSGVDVPVLIGLEETVGVQINSDDIKTKIEELMDDDEEGKMRRKRAKEIAISARKAVEEGGSSHTNLTRLIQDMKEPADLNTQ